MLGLSMLLLKLSKLLLCLRKLLLLLGLLALNNLNLLRPPCLTGLTRSGLTRHLDQLSGQLQLTARLGLHPDQLLALGGLDLQVLMGNLQQIRRG